jgi:hypothetical protein
MVHGEITCSNRMTAVRHTYSPSGVSIISELTQQRALDEYRKKARLYSIGPRFAEEALVMVTA